MRLGVHDVQHSFHHTHVVDSAPLPSLLLHCVTFALVAPACSLKTGPLQGVQPGRQAQQHWMTMMLKRCASWMQALFKKTAIRTFMGGNLHTGQ